MALAASVHFHPRCSVWQFQYWCSLIHVKTCLWMPWTIAHPGWITKQSMLQQPVPHLLVRVVSQIVLLPDVFPLLLLERHHLKQQQAHHLVNSAFALGSVVDVADGQCSRKWALHSILQLKPERQMLLLEVCSILEVAGMQIMSSESSSDSS